MMTKSATQISKALLLLMTGFQSWYLQIAAAIRGFKPIKMFLGDIFRPLAKNVAEYKNMGYTKEI